MSLSSMTGFGSHTTALPLGGSRSEKTSVVVELKSLNSRFFELTCKLPSSLGFLEIPISNYLKERLIRGRVFLTIKVGTNGEVFETVVPILKIAKDYVTAAETLKKKLKIKGDLTISDLVVLENVFSFECEPVGKSFEEAMLKIMKTVTDDLISTRKAEGERLLVDLEKRFKACSLHIEKVRELFDVFMAKEKETLKNMISAAERGDAVAEQSIKERYELLNKIDVHEEIVRFKSHLKNADKILASKDEENGKRLEFLLQELSREINTIAAKCSHFEISSVAVDIKVELEKVREQAQNIV